MKGLLKILIFILTLSVAQASTARFEQKVGAKLPRDTVFRDEEGKRVRLGALLDGKPIVLNLIHLGGKTHSNWVLRNLARSVAEIRLELGKQYRVVTISIDPEESPQALIERRREFLQWIPESREAKGGCRFLTGERHSIDRIAEAVGLHYEQDAKSGEYLQPAGIVIVDPDGTVSRYFFGASFPPAELGEALGQSQKGFFSSLYDAVRALGGLGG